MKEYFAPTLSEGLVSRVPIILREGHIYFSEDTNQEDVFPYELDNLFVSLAQLAPERPVVALRAKGQCVVLTSLETINIFLFDEWEWKEDCSIRLPERRYHPSGNFRYTYRWSNGFDDYYQVTLLREARTVGGPVLPVGTALESLANSGQTWFSDKYLLEF
jgi:hypothetical protein